MKPTIFPGIIVSRVEERSGDAAQRQCRSGAGLPVTYPTVCAQHAVVGDSQFAVESLKELAENTGATHFLVWMNIGSVPHELVKESMEQFAAEVIPKF